MTRKIYTAVLLSFAMMGGFVPSTLAEPPQAAAKAPSLYTQLGGYDALAAVTDDSSPAWPPIRHARNSSPD